MDLGICLLSGLWYNSIREVNNMLTIVTTCSDPALAAILFAVKNIMHLLQIIGPIAAIISIIWQFVKLTANPDDKKGVGKIRNSAIALVVLFIIPVVTDAAFALLDDSLVISDCWNNTTHRRGNGRLWIAVFLDNERMGCDGFNAPYALT